MTSTQTHSTFSFLQPFIAMVYKKKKKTQTKRTPVSRKKPKMDEPCLPSEIITDILTRVPIESLFRFRCVCKRWNNLVADPFFTRLYSGRADPSFVFFDFEDSNMFFFHIEKKEKAKLQCDLGRDIGAQRFELLYSCNGLLLLCSFDQSSNLACYYVYNPVTKRYASVPAVDLKVEPQHVVYALAFDSLSGKYKIVCCGYSGEDGGYVCKIITVGVGEESWREVVFPAPHRLPEYPPVFANGGVHWMMGSRDIENLGSGDYFIEFESMGRILSLDVDKEEFYTVPRPHCQSGVYTLLEADGLLCFFNHVSNTELKIWVLEDLEKLEWREMHNVNMGHLEMSGTLPFKGFLEDSYPFSMVFKLNKIIIKRYDTANDCAKFLTYDLVSGQLDGELGVDPSWVTFKKEFELKFFPLKYVPSLALM